MKIGNVTIDSRLALAPMAGVTDLAFRTICRELGAGYTVTEMVSAKALCYQDQKSLPLLKLGEGEHPAAAQLFGSDEGCMQEAAAIAGELSETRNRLAAERQAFTRRMDRVAEDASRHCAGLPAGWVRLYNEALGLAPAAPEASAPAAGIGAPAGSASATGAGVRSGASVMVSPEDLLAHARDYGGYCRNLRAQAEALLAVEKGREVRP